jgi:hypothetical protein
MCRRLQGAVVIHVTNRHMLVVWWLTATIVMILLWLTLFRPGTPTFLVML